RLAAEDIDRILNAKGCGGPHCLLKELERVLEHLSVDIGTWKGKDVIRLQGALKCSPQDYPEGLLAPRSCRLYLDARTLWPHRLEWWTSKRPDDPPFLLLQLEFRDPEIN